MATAVAHNFLSKETRVRKDLDIRAGDTVRVHVKIVEKGKTRTQIFEGLVLARKHGNENGGTFTVRKITNGVGVERIFPLFSPMIDKIEIVRRSRTRRSKIYFIRTKVAREIRRTMRNFVNFAATTDELVIPAEEMMDETPEETENVENTEETGEQAEEAEKQEAPEENTADEAPQEEPATPEEPKTEE